MPHIEGKNPIVFGGGQRSPGDTWGQTLKTLLTQYLEVGSLDEFHTYCADAMPYSKRKNPIVFGGVQRSSGSPGGSNLETELPTSTDFPYSVRKIIVNVGMRIFT
ncbi:hypothetical protein HOLleu_39772 [Holothuria leucospilota]|uniref:Uncharacterized protein n=1 Tax=Holothuria leucospilota TaxID=206669 RepID=A0A9Q0YK82_HOLLE|nr:hypothetical protein HOLleu_39772 [Holothuria leucospilota]